MSDERKLGIYLTEQERVKLNEIMSGINLTEKNLTNHHVKERMKERNISMKVIQKSWKAGEIIEVHRKDSDIRVLVRGLIPFDKNNHESLSYNDDNICMVVSLVTGSVISTYRSPYGRRFDYKQKQGNEVDYSKDWNVTEYLH